MTLTKNIIPKEEAVKLAPDYVKAMEGNWNLLSRVIIPAFEKLKKNQTAITFHENQYVKVTISSINNNTPAAIDGPVARVSNTEASWRVDGDHYAFPIKE